MGAFGEETSTKVYGKLPKVGEAPVVIKLKEVNKVEFPNWAEKGLQYCPNFSCKKNPDYGYHYVVIADDKDSTQYSIKTWSLLKALQKSKADIGDTVSISHPEHGKYDVKVAKDGDDVAWTE